MQRIYTQFSLPVFTDEEQTLRARILFLILLSLMAGSMLAAFVSALSGAFTTALIMIVFLPPVIFATWLTKRRRFQLASFFTLFTLLLATITLQIFGQGVHDLAISIYPIIIIIASILLRKKVYAAFVVLVILAFGLVVYLETINYLPNDYTEFTSGRDFIFMGIILTVTAVTMRLITKHLWFLLRQSRRNQEALIQSNQELMQQKAALQVSEAEIRAFQQKLQTLHEVGLELAQATSLESLYRSGIELGRKKLGFDRLGILLFDENANQLVGTYGTSEIGEVVNEYDLRETIDRPLFFEILSDHKRLVVVEETPLFHRRRQVGSGWHALTGLWNGRKGIGWLSADNLLQQKAPSADLIGILPLYGATLGNLIARMQAEIALRESEERYRTILETIEDGYYEVDLHGCFTFFNDALCRIAGVSPAELAGASYKRLQTEEASQTVFHIFNEVYRTGRSVKRFEHTLDAEPDNHRDVEISISLIRDGEGQPVGFRGIVRDVSERKIAEKQLTEYALQLEQKNKELEDFAYVASHDLQEPLRKIKVFGDRLESKYDDVLDERGRDYLKRMQNAAVRMQHLILALLDFSRVATRPRPFISVDLNDIVAEVLTDLETAVAETNAQTTIEPLPTIEADPIQLRQLFQNLISNALKFHQEGQIPAIKIWSETIAEGNEEWVRIRVADNGIGFDPQYVDRIFEVFQRLHDRQTYEGTGVGLAICKKIILRHNGRISAMSTPNQGATFTVELPLQQPSQQTV